MSIKEVKPLPGRLVQIADDGILVPVTPVHDARISDSVFTGKCGKYKNWQETLALVPFDYIVRYFVWHNNMF